MCFKEFYDRGIYLFANKSNYCAQCLHELKPIFAKFKVLGYNALAIYEYDDRIKSLLYQFKGCFDIEIADIFLARFRKELCLLYDGYVMVPITSFKEDDDLREFNHVEEMFKIIKIPMVKALVKTAKIKQANSNNEQRKQIGNYLELFEGVNLKNKKVLIVDDVFTTGATMEASISLIKKLEPKKIQVLVMSKAPLKPLNNE